MTAKTTTKEPQDAADAPDVATVPETPLSPSGEPPAAQVPIRDVRCQADDCHEVLVHIEPSGAAILHVYERQVLRPHTLAPDELPLAWRCHRCGEPITITA